VKRGLLALLGREPAGRHHKDKLPEPAFPLPPPAPFDADLLSRIDALTPAQQLDALVLLAGRVPDAVGEVVDLVLPKQPAP